MFDCTDSVDLLERKLRHTHRSAITAELTAAGLQEIGHPMLLCILESSEGAPGRVQAQRDLANLLNISPAAVATSLKSLERGGYVRREPAEGDARCNRVILTEKGRSAVEGCRSALDRVNRRMLAGFSPEEREQIGDFYRRMLHNLRGNPPEKCTGKDG